MPGTTSYPRITTTLREAPLVDAYEGRRDVICGQIGTGGTATSGELYENVQSLTKAEIRALFGDDELYGRILQWLAGNERFSLLNVIALDPEGGATAATGEVVFSGTATADGTLTFAAVDERQFDVSVSVESGDDETAVGDKLEAAFSALENYPPFLASNASGTVTLIASDVGTAGNYYGIKGTGAVAGLSFALTGWSGGATDPSVTGIFDPLEGIRVTGVNWPQHWQDDIDEPTTSFLDPRFNVSNDILDGVAFMGKAETYANQLSFVSTLNSQSLVVMGNNKINETLQKGPASMSNPSWDVAYFQGVRAKRLTPNAPIADNIVAQGGPLDNFGGPALASLPYFNTPMPFVPVAKSTYLFSKQDQVDLNRAGVSTYGVNDSLNGMISGAIVTTRTTDAAGNENDSFHYLNFIDTASTCREIFYRNLKATFAQSRLTEGDIPDGRSAANEQIIKAELKRIFRVLANQGLVQLGSAAEKYFADNTTVDISAAGRSATITSLLPIVTQLEEINYALTLSFTTESTGTQTVF